MILFWNLRLAKCAAIKAVQRVLQKVLITKFQRHILYGIAIEIWKLKIWREVQNWIQKLKIHPHE
jgi:hypothetical protein